MIAKEREKVKQF